MSGGAVLWESLVTGGRSMMGIGVACATAGIIVGVMTLGREAWSRMWCRAWQEGICHCCCC